MDEQAKDQKPKLQTASKQKCTVQSIQLISNYLEFRTEANENEFFSVFDFYVICPDQQLLSMESVSAPKTVCFDIQILSIPHRILHGIICDCVCVRVFV